MTIQDTYLTALDRFGDVARDAEADSGLVDRADDYREQVTGFRVLIPLVGSFNAGKTSLVNAWLERPAGGGLPTDIVPQTALATEIHMAGPDGAERVELYGTDDRSLRRIDLAEFGRIEKESITTGETEAEYARATLRAPAGYDGAWPGWKVLVDMPGLDSGLRTHNAAIQRYLPLGSYFILVVDVEHGALRATEIEQLREFLDRDVRFAVLVNKIDKQQEAAAVVEHIRQQVRRALGKDVEVLPVSAHAPDIDAFRTVVDSIDFDSPLRNYWRTRILQLFDDAVESLHTRYSALNVSSADRERAVADLEERKRALEGRLADDEQEIRERYSDGAVDRIVGGVRDAIRDHAQPLAQTWQSGGHQAFQYELNEVVRRTLNRVVDKQLQETWAQIVAGYGADLAALDEHREAFLHAGSQAATFDLPGELAGRVGAAAQASTQAWDQARKRFAGATASTVAVGVLAATTAIVAPWLEVVLIAAPTIVRWLREKAEGQRRQQQMEERLTHLQAQITSRVAPRVASDLRERAGEGYASAARDLIAGLRGEVRGKVERIQADIDRSRAEIEDQKRDVEQRREQLKAAIERLIDARTPVEG